MKKLITLTFLTICYLGLVAQIRLDVEGDAKILGKLALDAGDENVFIGKNAGLNNDPSLPVVLSGSKNTFIGFEAGKENTSGQANTFVGRSSGRLNTTGYGNAFFGEEAGNNNTTGYGNAFFGEKAGSKNESGYENAFFGKEAGHEHTTGSANAFFGKAAGFRNKTGESNAFFGWHAGFNNTASSNAFFGRSAGVLNINGDENAFFGMYAGANHSNTRSTLIGQETETTDSLNQAIAIGYKARVACHNCAVVGGTGVNAVKVGIGTETPLNDLHIKQSDSHTARGIRLEHATDVDYWTTYIDGVGDYNFAYEGSLKAYITRTGEYVDHSSFRSPTDGSSSRNSQVKSMNKVLAKVKRLEPTTRKLHNGRNSRTTWGFEAEKVAQLFPEITPEKDGKKGIIYNYFGILSIKAIQELAGELETQEKENVRLQKENKSQNEQLINQQQQLDNQQTQIEELKSLVTQLLAQNAETPKSNSYVLSLDQPAHLAQNQPNPFREHTIVPYFVPATVKNAYLQVTNMDGKVLRQVAITEKGQGQVTIQSNNYPAGTYFYSLVLDGQVMETKRMVLAR